MRHQKKRKFKIIKRLILFLFAFFLIWRVLIPFAQGIQRQLLPIPRLSQTGKPLVSSKGLSSDNAVLIRRSDGQVLMDKNADQKIYPASMTKIMTVVIALQRFPLPDQRITLSSDIFERMEKAGASTAGFCPGERVRSIDLMYGALLPSGGECAAGLAKAIAGSESAFADMMNQQAQKIGMKHTHFVNSTGLHDKNQYSTVKDIALLLDYALQDSTFRKMITAHSHHTSMFDNKKFGGITFQSTILNGKNSVEIPDGEILGGKTGYTDEAGYCLASLAKVKGQEYILVTAHAPQDGNNIEDAVKVYGKL
jgi:D-alanyl-D-alanine carboxypeptidase (penicillin-binding protein 5/6)